MKPVIKLTAAAIVDLKEASDWYAAIDADLGSRFVDAVNSCFNKIQRSPSSFPVVSGTDVRRSVVRRFKYIVLFSARSEHVIVHAIFHTSRNPIIWQGRID